MIRTTAIFFTAACIILHCGACSLSAQDLPTEQRVELPPAGLDLDITPRLEVPAAPAPDRVLAKYFSMAPEPAAASIKPVTWTSDAFGFQTLLFEEPCLERYGLAHPPAQQTLRSGFQFFSQGALLPIKMLRGKHRGHQHHILDNPIQPMQLQMQDSPFEYNR